MSNSLHPVLTQLLSQGATLLVYLAAIVAALVFWRRSPAAAALTIVGAGLLLVLAVGWALIIGWVIANGPPSRVPMSMLSLGSNVLAAVAHVLWLAAIFVGRREGTVMSAFPVGQATPRADDPYRP